MCAPFPCQFVSSRTQKKIKKMKAQVKRLKLPVRMIRPSKSSISPYSIRGCTIEDIEDEASSPKEWLPHSHPFILEIVDDA